MSGHYLKMMTFQRVEIVSGILLERTVFVLVNPTGRLRGHNRRTILIIGLELIGMIPSTATTVFYSDVQTLDGEDVSEEVVVEREVLAVVLTHLCLKQRVRIGNIELVSCITIEAETTIRIPGSNIGELL